MLIVTVAEGTRVTPSFCQLMLVGEPEAVQVNVTIDPSDATAGDGC